MKGQGSMEYLMTYGWAILVIIVIGVVIWSLGIFDTQGSMTMKGFKFIKPQLTGTSLTANGVFVGTFMNGMGSTVQVLGVDLNNTYDKKACTMSPSITFPMSLARGDNFKLDASDCNSGSHTNSDNYDLMVTIHYTVKIGSVETEHNEVGYISGLYT